ncbi:MAG TPA: hypothetical protein VFC31_03345 [Candidatus Limnocylindria bacterium]|nr:hypothetical protein [Candidatus Limnocylindria bacterium]
MGTRYDDQPAEHWAGPESLDPTPVWKQYLLVALLLFAGLVVVVVVAIAALAPQLATPPALVPGDRLVLAVSDLPAVGAPAKRIGIPIVRSDEEFLIAQPAKGRYVAVRTTYAPRPASSPACTVEAMSGSSLDDRTFIAECGGGAAPTFNGRGRAIDSGARDLDQYLVSVSGDRVIVNLSRVIQADERTLGPVPTGIPRPRQTP